MRAALGGGATPGVFNDIDTFTFRGYRRERIKIILLRAQPPGTQQGTEAALVVHAPDGKLVGRVHGALPLILSLRPAPTRSPSPITSPRNAPSRETTSSTCTCPGQYRRRSSLGCRWNDAR